MAARKKVVEKKVVVELDPVIEAQNLLLEIEQAEQDIKDEVERDMVRAEIEHKAIIKKNARESAAKRYDNIDAAKKLIKLSEECVRQAKVGHIDGRYKIMLDLMYGFIKEDQEAALKNRK